MTEAHDRKYPFHFQVVDPKESGQDKQELGVIVPILSFIAISYEVKYSSH